MRDCEQKLKIQNFYSDSSQLDAHALDNKQLLKAQSNFIDFVNTIGPLAFTPLSPLNLRFSKEILRGVFDAVSIKTLVDKRVERMMKNYKIKKNWGKQDCTILAWILQKVTNGRHIKSPEKIKNLHWQKVASMIPGVNAQDCMFKWLSMKKIKLSNNKWSQNQSRMLQKAVLQFGTQNWKRVSRFIFVNNRHENKKYRSPKQCRQQWNCYLNPLVKKGTWSRDEDIQLLKEVQSQGRKWSLICKSTLIGRTENALKNRYNFIMQNRRCINPNECQQNILKQCLEQLQNNTEEISQSTPYQSKEDEMAEIRVTAQEQQKIINNEKSKEQVNQNLQMVTIIECNLEQLAQHLRRSSSFIPAKLENNLILSFDGQTQKYIKVQFEKIIKN